MDITIYMNSTVDGCGDIAVPMMCVYMPRYHGFYGPWSYMSEYSVAKCKDWVHIS